MPYVRRYECCAPDDYECKDRKEAGGFVLCMSDGNCRHRSENILGEMEFEDFILP